MKRDFLLQLTFQDGSKLSKAAVDAILDEHGRELEQLKRGYSEYPQLKKELEQAKAQVAAFMALKPQKLFEQMDADEKRIAYLESLRHCKSVLHRLQTAQTLLLKDKAQCCKVSCCNI